MEIKSPSGKNYVVGKEIGKDERFKFYQCTFEDNKVCILKIASDLAYNGLLDREAYILQTLEEAAFETEKEYEKVKTTDKFLNYHFFFPKLIETFIAEDQGGSRVSIVSFKHIAKSLNELTPICHLPLRENVRVDPRTSAWILGKLLTMLAFTQIEGVVVNDLSSDNILINREQHYVSIFDWTSANLVLGNLSRDLVAEKISKVAKEVTWILGGNVSTGKLPVSKQLEGNLYEDYLSKMCRGLEKNVKEAHKKFYDIVSAAWPKEFYQFTVYNKQKGD